VLADGEMEVIEPGNDHVFSFVRSHGGERVAVLANFSEQPQTITAYHLRTQGFGQMLVDRISQVHIANPEVTLASYQLMVIIKAGE
jgi:amylosucrase